MGTDVAGGDVDLADSMIHRVADKHIPSRVDGHMLGPIDLGGGGRPAVAAESRRPRTGDGRDRGKLNELANALVAGIGNVDLVWIGVDRGID